MREESIPPLKSAHTGLYVSNLFLTAYVKVYLTANFANFKPFSYYGVYNGFLR